MVNNLQGHSAYAKDALITSQMNFCPGGKQAHMHDGWYYNGNGKKIMQKMVFENSELKGIKAVVQEHGLWKTGMGMECSDKACSIEDQTDCCCRHILDLQPDFKSQKSLV